MKTEPSEAIHLQFDEQHQRIGDMPPVKCGLCGTLASARAIRSGQLQGDSCWECPCGARGVRVMLVDLDEVYEEVLECWGLEAREPDVDPPAPVGDSGLMFGTYVDGHGLRTQLFNDVRDQGAEVAATEVVVKITNPRTTLPDWTWDVLWARRASGGRLQ
ncbi:hypothetical protein [Corallococcus aberystwythensis]|uniref:Uncharacterized protein n=1 Tax=Corallococcus aberystwythensis TaxID=2316722 RepID=A0A3A8QW93_9BACT|nr:hypothetical protein [Corallococcus aberystwythensis]RKH72943.1 hypothetical protein D7W81_04970 [Corallococcus aberystwythensis]